MERLPVGSIINEYRAYKKEINDMKNIKAGYKFDKFKDIKKIYDSVKDDECTYVIVIGESVDRGHMGIYGYYRDTTKYTDNISNMFYFDRITSPHAHTLPSLKKVLTFAYDNKMNIATEKGSVINYFNDAGFKTFWISNQYAAGDWDNFVSAIGQNAQEYIFANKNKWSSCKSSYDEILIPYFEKALNDTAKKKIIFLHLMGSHGAYENRYPKLFDCFKPEKEADIKIQSALAHYDNSVLYTNYIISEIINKLKQKNDLSYMFYFSDHSDEVYEYSCLGHAESNATKHMFDVPVMLWLSDKYISVFEQTGIIDKIKNAAHIPYNSQLMPDTILQISNLTNEDADFNKSILSDYPQPSEYVSDRQIDIPKKSIWLHRTNNREKLIRNFDKYTGFEMDIRFNEQENYFNVDHDNNSGGEKLQEVLNTDGIGSKYFWFDFKNLSYNNKKESLLLLNKITDELKIPRSHIVVESSELKELKEFKEAGYYTSFYLSCYSWGDTDTYLDYIRNDIRKLSDSTVDFVSSDSKDFNRVCYYFPKAAHLFWYMGKNKLVENKYIFDKDNNAYVVLNIE